MPRFPHKGTQGDWQVVSESQLPAGKFRSFHSCLNLFECRIPSRGSVIRKRSEATVVRGSKLFDRQERCRFQNPIAHLGRSLNHWMNRIDDAYENKLFSVCQLLDDGIQAPLVGLAGHLQIKPAGMQAE